jgi:hypothetical protein
MKMTSKARNPIVVEISGNLAVQARAAHLQAFTADAKRLVSNNRRGLLLIAIEE